MASALIVNVDTEFYRQDQVLGLNASQERNKRRLALTLVDDRGALSGALARYRRSQIPAAGKK